LNHRKYRLKKQFTITIEKESNPNAGYSVFCKELAGCFSNGVTKKEALENMREAINLHLGLAPKAEQFSQFQKSLVPQLVKFLQSQCFTPQRQTKNHLTLYNYRNVAITVPIHKTPDFGHKLFSRILKETGCNVEDFLDGGKN